MPCKNCEKKPVISLPSSKAKLCRGCFIKYFERKVLKTIKKYNLIDNGETIGVAVSSGKDSFAALYILNKLANTKRIIKVKAIAIDEGIHGYRDLSPLIKYCKDNNIELHTHNFEDEFGYSLDEALKKLKGKPCSICGVLRRYLLNKKARELGVDKLATGHNLDDEAQTILMNQFKGNLERSSRLGPSTGVVKDKRFIPRIKPLFFLTEREAATYAYLMKFPVKFNECPNMAEGLRNDVRELINDMEVKHHGSKYGIVNSFLESLPTLKKQYSHVKIKECISCGEPSSSGKCQACKILDKLKEKI